jgi:F-type H+-transporting ATPase subunit alpha
LQGFASAFISEIFVFSASGSNTPSTGLVVSLYRDSLQNLVIGALLLSSNSRLSLGTKVSGIQRLASLNLGDFAVGSILDPIGNYINNSSRLSASFRWLIETPAPSIISRQSVFEPMLSGIISIDAMIPIGRGQRELIIGDRQTGKTSIGVDTIINQKFQRLFAIYLPIGQKAATILEVYISLIRRSASCYLTVFAASASSSAVLQYLSAYSGSALSEYFMYVRELPVFIFFDDLSKHAQAFREISLLLRRPPGREAYPGEVFYLHSRLLERSAKLSPALGGGSNTSFPVIETLAGDVSAYIPTNVISITDGQIFLSQDLFHSGIKPAVSVGLSVSRVGSAAQTSGMKVVAGSYKLELAQFAELESFSQFASDLGDDAKSRLARGRRLVETLKQQNGAPIELCQQIGILSLANQNVIEKCPLQSITSFFKIFLSLPS